MGLKRSRSDSLSLSEPENPPSPFTRESTHESVKIVHLDVPAHTKPSHNPAVMKCSLPPHTPLTFSTFEEYDVHYQKTHVNRCQECRKNFPDEHFLHLHIAENHDPISRVRKERGEKIFNCLIPTCTRPCSTPQKRRLHCIDKHQFPRDYDFFIVRNGIDKRNSMLRQQHRRRSSAISVNGGNKGSGERRGESSASAMDVVDDEERDEKVDEDENEESSEEESSEESFEGEQEAPPPLKPKQPVKTVLPMRLMAHTKPTPTKTLVEEASSEDDESSEEEKTTDAPPNPTKSPKPTHPRSPTPLKLRGRGGFGRVGQRGTPSSTFTSAPAAAPAPATTKSLAKAETKDDDHVEGLVNSMSALCFVPNSVRKARERAKSNAAMK